MEGVFWLAATAWHDGVLVAFGEYFVEVVFLVEVPEHCLAAIWNMRRLVRKVRHDYEE